MREILSSLVDNLPSQKHVTDNGIIIIIPACNDGSAIGSLILNARQFASQILVIDDGSSDNTPLVAECAGTRTIRHQQKTGFNASVIEGIKAALMMDCVAAVIITGDARFRVQDIPRICEPLHNGEADLVIGSRYSETVQDLPVKQKLKQHHLGTTIPEKDLPMVTDPYSGFMALNRKTIEFVSGSSIPEKTDNTVLALCIARGMTIREVPVIENPNVRQKSDWIDPAPVVVAIPAYNEERTLPGIILAAQQFCDAVIVVNDGSGDLTGPIAEKMGAIVITHEKNRGYGAALRTIFSAAASLNAAALIVIDADGQHDPMDIQKILLPVLDGADIVVGSRCLGEKTDIPLYRKTGMRVLDAATNYAGNLDVTDSQSGYRAYSKKAIRTIHITDPDMGAGSEILVQAKEQGLTIVEVPITVRYEIPDKSSRNPLTHGIRVLESIIWHITQKRPLSLIGIPGLILCIIGIYFGITLLQLYNTNQYFSVPLSILIVMFLILGALGIFMGVTFHIISRILPRYEHSIVQRIRDENATWK